MGTGVEEAFLLDAGAEALGGAELLGGAEALGAGAELGAGALGGAEALGSAGIGSLVGDLGSAYGGLNGAGAFLNPSFAANLGVGATDYGALLGGNSSLTGGITSLGAPGYSSTLPGSLNPTGIYATQTGASLTPYSPIQSLSGVGPAITPTQELLIPNQYENVFTGAENSTNPLTVGEGTIYTPPTTANTPGFFNNLKTAVNPFSDTNALDRLSALGNAGSKAAEAVFLNKDGDLNMSTVLAGLSLYPTYAAAKAKAGEKGIPFSEADYQAGKIAPSKERFAMMAPKSAFGIRSIAANGGRMGFGSGGMSDNRISQLIQLLRDADARGDQDTVDQIKLDLYRETRKATGGRIGYKDGKLVLEEGPANKATRLQMEKAAREAQKRYADMKAQDKLMDENYKRIAPYESLKELKTLYDMAPDEGYPPMPEPTPPEGVLSIRLTPTQKKAKGGRAGYADGAGPIPLGLVDYRGTPWENSFKAVTQPIERKIGLFSNPDGSYPGENMTNPIQALPRPGQYDTSGDGMESLIKQPYVPTNRPVNDLYQYYLNQENDEDKRKQIMGRVNPLFGIKKAHGGMMNHPIRRLEGGISELDLRAKGGFIPIGVKEKADDVPAMLSKNEFVFTADAVRNAGGGSINKGAQKMYKLMKSLENKKVNRKAN